MQLRNAFLSSSENESGFIRFLASYWADSCHRKKLNEKMMYVGCEEECHKVANEGVSIKEELNSTQEEAHMTASACTTCGSESVVIVSENTNVFLLRLAFQELLSVEIFMDM